jgi:hypothetical protein
MLWLWSLMHCAELIQCFIIADLSWSVEMDNPGFNQTTGLSSVELTTRLQVMDGLLP